MIKNKVDFITLGCSKNLVDSEHLIKQLELNGYEVAHDAENITGEIAVVNTCGFIGDAKEESINMILELCELKKQGKLKKLYVMGCLSERYLKDLEDEIPEVDRYFGKFDWNQLLDELGKQYYEEKSRSRRITTPSHYAYVKISEGCDRRCSYCAIPIITGKHISRPMEDILEEVKELDLTSMVSGHLNVDEMLEYAIYSGNYYGTPKAYVEEQLEAGKDVILEIEIQGALKVKEKFPELKLICIVCDKNIRYERLTTRDVINYYLSNDDYTYETGIDHFRSRLK